MSLISQRPKSIRFQKVHPNLNKTIEFIIALAKDCYHVSVESFFFKVFIVKKYIVERPRCNQEYYQNALFQGPNMEICGDICLLSGFLIVNKLQFKIFTRKCQVAVQSI